ncbi:hypothetical protein MRX96_014853 [Rhipicephalus microplus]
MYAWTPTSASAPATCPEFRAHSISTKDDGRILSFDNNTDMVQKLCSLRLQHLTFAYGIAAYDVDYEDYSQVCDSVSVLGSFTRVFTLTLLRDYVEIVFNVRNEYTDCLRLAY